MVFIIGMTFLFLLLIVAFCKFFFVELDEGVALIIKSRSGVPSWLLD